MLDTYPRLLDLSQRGHLILTFLINPLPQLGQRVITGHTPHFYISVSVLNCQRKYNWPNSSLVLTRQVH